MQVLIFDVDGVLVEAQGYQQALQDTIAHFSRALGVGDWPPCEQEVRQFEAHGMSSEWDICAACVAALLIERWAEEPDLTPPAEWERALAHWRARPRSRQRPDYVMLARQIGSGMKAGLPVAVAVRRVIEGRARPWLGEGWQTLARMLDRLFGDVHDVQHSPVTRHFQHLVLGSERIEPTYGLPAEFSTPSYLEEYDRSLLSPRARDQVQRSREAGWAMAMCTLRPSSPPLEEVEKGQGYAPEAELARSLVGLQDIPAIGQGHMLWLARQRGAKVQELMKPLPAQALAAVGASLGAPESQALQAAYELERNKRLSPPLDRLRSGAVHMFEDTTAGLVACKAAIDVLRATGADLSWHPHGIAAAGSVKETALRAQGATIHASVDDAIHAVLTGSVERTK
jgi:hypothetical protein